MSGSNTAAWEALVQKTGAHRAAIGRHDGQPEPCKEKRPTLVAREEVLDGNSPSTVEVKRENLLDM